MSEVEFLCKLRDAASMIVDACEEHLERIAPAETRELGDFDMLVWEPKQPQNGEPYEQADHGKNKGKEFEILQKKLQDNNGFWQTKTCKFWAHMGDFSLIDRRKK